MGLLVVGVYIYIYRVYLDPESMWNKFFLFLIGVGP